MIKFPSGFSSLFLQLFIFHQPFLLLFFRCFHFTNCFFTVIVFCQALRFSVAVPQVLRISESFFTSFLTLHFLPHFPQYREYYGNERAFFTLRNYLPYNPSYNLAQPAIIKASLGPAVLHWSLQDLPLRFETQIRPICLLESNSTQQKLSVGRFYLCIKALPNTISTSSRFWTHCLIAICFATRMPYPLDHRSS